MPKTIIAQNTRYIFNRLTTAGKLAQLHPGISMHAGRKDAAVASKDALSPTDLETISLYAADVLMGILVDDELWNQYIFEDNSFIEIRTK